MVKKNGKVVCFDVDETLIYWFYDEDRVDVGEIFIGDTLYQFNEIELERLRNFYNSGYEVIVWSQGGKDWAESVCVECDVYEFVDSYMTKPSFMIDDISPEKWTTHKRPMNYEHNNTI